MNCRLYLILMVIGALAVPPTLAGDSLFGDETGLSCLVRIRPPKAPFVPGALSQLCESAGVLAAAANAVEPIREHREAHRLPLQEVVAVRTDTRQDGNTVFATITVFVDIDREVPETEQAARALLREMCKRLEAELERVSAEDRVALEQRVERARQDARLAYAQFEELQKREQELYAAAGVHNLSREQVLGELKTLEDEQRRLEMELAAQAAREQMLREQIAKIGATAEDLAGNDDVAAELARVVELREKELQRRLRLHDGSVITQEQVAEAQEQLAIARARLAERREALVHRAGAGALAALNEKLLGTAEATAELTARMHSISAQIEAIKAKGLLELADRFELEVELQRHQAESQYRRAITMLNNYEEELRYYQPPRLSVIGGVAE